MATRSWVCAFFLGLTLTAWAAPPAEPVLIPTAEVEKVREEKDPFFLDVRTAAEIMESGSLPDYYNIPIDELEKRLDELPRERLILTA